MSTVVFEKVTAAATTSSADHAVRDLSLTVRSGELLMLTGTPGSGMSTALRTLAGLEPVQSGRLLVGRRDVTGASPEQRDIAMAFQNYALYPHLSVEDNIGFPLRLAGRPKAEIRDRVREAAALLSLEPYLESKPRRLTPQQRQSVALARALVRRPDVLCLDEPLSNVAGSLRYFSTTLDSLRRTGITMLCASSDVSLAMALGDRVAVFEQGRLRQVDAPSALRTSPAHLAVAQLVAEEPLNILPVQSAGPGGRIGNVGVLVADGKERLDLVVAVPADALTPAEEGPGLRTEVEVVEQFEDRLRVWAAWTSEEGETFSVCLAWDGEPPASGKELFLRMRPEALRCFGRDSGAAVSVQYLLLDLIRVLYGHVTAVDGATISLISQDPDSDDELAIDLPLAVAGREDLDIGDLVSVTITPTSTGEPAVLLAPALRVDATEAEVAEALAWADHLLERVRDAGDG